MQCIVHSVYRGLPQTQQLQTNIVEFCGFLNGLNRQQMTYRACVVWILNNICAQMKGIEIELNVRETRDLYYKVEMHGVMVMLGYS